MRNATIDGYLPAAMKVIDNYVDYQKKLILAERKKKNKAGFKETIENVDYNLKKEYKSYLSSFGPSILMSSLKPTIAVYAADSGKAERKVVLEWLGRIYYDKHQEAFNKDNKFPYAEKILKEVIEKHDNQLGYTSRKLKDISIALKLCIRTFKLEAS